MKHLIYVFLFISQLAVAEHLLILGDDSARPKNWLTADGKPMGIMVDLLDEVSKRTDIQFTYQFTPWARAFNASENGFGAIIGFSKSKERELHWDYSVPMYFDELIFVTTKNHSFNYSDLDSLKGKLIAIKRGASYGDDFEQALKDKVFEIEQTADRVGQLKMLERGRVDAILLSPGIIALKTLIAKDKKLQEKQDIFEVVSPSYKSDPNFLGIPKSINKSHLIPIINQALLDMEKEGITQKIIDKNIQIVLDEIKMSSN